MAGGEGPTRADTFEVQVKVQDVTNKTIRVMMDLGTFDKRSGGQKDSESNIYYPGGMADPVSLGGRATTDNIVVSRLYRIVRDHVQLSQKLLAGVGKADMEVYQYPLDLDGNLDPNIKPIVWVGTLKRTTLPEHDSSSSGDPAMIELEMTVDGFPHLGS